MCRNQLQFNLEHPMSIKTVEQKEDLLSIKIHFSTFLYWIIWNGCFKTMTFIKRYVVATSLFSLLTALGSYTSVHKLGIIIILLLNFYVYHTLINNVQGQFYYILGNLEPRLRSTLKGIQLIACITPPSMG